MSVNSGKIWANSGDSHLVEPRDLFTANLPKDLAERMPRSVRDADGQHETIHVDGQSFRRRLPTPDTVRRNLPRPEEAGDDPLTRAPGASDPRLRLADLDAEGIWAEVIYPSLGVWTFNIVDPKLLTAGTRLLNDWTLDFQHNSPRYVCCASIPLLDVDDAVAEVERAAGMGFHVGFLPTRPPFSRPPWHDPVWDPMWAAFAATGMVIGFHIGTEPHKPTENTGVYHHGRGGAVLNYVETSYGGQRSVTQLIACGALDHNPELRVLVSEGGATWGPFIADRMDEGYRQHSAAVRPKLSKLPSQYLYEQVYASFQHDRSAISACSAMGWQNVMWGSDYPHYEGTYGHTQKTLHELFDDVAQQVRRRITVGAFQELFPHVPSPPA